MRKVALRNLPVDRLRPNPFQPRGSCDDKELARLAESIRGSGGIIEPITVRWKDGVYEIACGHRRWLAAKRLSERTVPAVICEISDAEMLQTVLVENLQRQDLNPLDEAKCLAILKERFKMTHKGIGLKIGKTEDFVTQRIRLLSLPDRIRLELSRDRISPSVAEAIAAKPLEIQNTIISRIEAGWRPTVREVSEFDNRTEKQGTKTGGGQRTFVITSTDSIVGPGVRLTGGVWSYYNSMKNEDETITRFLHRVILTYFTEKGYHLKKALHPSVIKILGR